MRYNKTGGNGTPHGKWATFEAVLRKASQATKMGIEVRSTLALRILKIKAGTAQDWKEASLEFTPCAED